MVSNGSLLDCLGLEAVGENNDNDSCLTKENHVNADDDNVKKRNLFYELLKIYRELNCSRGGSDRPARVFLGDGQSVDLYELFSLVKDGGGYAAVSVKGLWGYVTEELCLDLHVLASVKLVYHKHLKDFEAWLKRTFEDKIFRHGNYGRGWGFKTLELEIEKELRGLLCPNINENDDDLVELEPKKIGKCIDSANLKNETYLLDTKTENNVCEDVQSDHADDDDKLHTGVKDDLATLDKEVADLATLDKEVADLATMNREVVDLATLGKEMSDKEFNYRKRKREALSGMLNWMKHSAKHPLVPVTPPLPKPSKWKECKGQDLFFQVLRARVVLSKRRCVEPNGGSASFQNQKMHPSMYEEEVARGHHSTARLRCSGRQPTSVKSRLCSCCNSRSANGNRLTSSVNMEAEKSPVEEKAAKVELLTPKKVEGKFAHRKVSIGPHHQAEVPKWTGVVLECDSKWPGTQVWPLEQDSKPEAETDLIGRERELKCSCKIPGSVECNRFHIAENRMELKRELGPLFYHWGFDRMGEEVSLQWTAEEERRFKDLMRSDAPIWTNASRYFPRKRRRNLVNYYFNNFVTQRRIYQNRVTPSSIDSDNDEVEFGSFGYGFGMEALKVHEVLPECSENKQCTDFEY
ncbi:hypothetical protein RIF29_34453 [Crotalaria pallida]|uniref:ARID domain-containing protein n=1 Tax=Crotalaria pallida TaxID=3830 RepID=A0AAN9HTJ3_CROPI